MNTKIDLRYNYYYHGVRVIILGITPTGVEFGYYPDSVGFFREYSSSDFPKKGKNSKNVTT